MSRFAQRVFTWSGIYGLIVLTPQYFMASRIGRDPVRFRPVMVPAVLEKLAFGVPAIALFAQGRLPASVLFFGLVDLVLGALFVMAWLVTPRAGSPPSGSPGTVGRRAGA